MTISLPPDLQRLVDEKVRAGPYSTPEDLVRAALAHFVQYGDDFESGELDKLLSVGTTAIEQRNVHSGEAVFEEIRSLSAERRRGHAS
jgi:Arc/MetJ-type ribon-helix-helix transcriptional regulator